ncbi:MAG: hypothetical protein F6K36_08965 [Symploca sp. SIO3C6]|nr:hypothetical protein [Symploca sp. SIO3C6]
MGGIAIAVLNQGLRPFLSKWHPNLQSWEMQRPGNISLAEHDKNWHQEPQMRRELQQLNQELGKYAEALAEIFSTEN